MFQAVKADVMIGIYYSPEGPDFHPFRSTASRFRVTVNFSIGGRSCGGATTVKPKSAMVQVHMLTGMYYAPAGPHFRPFRSTGSRFRVTVNFSIGDGTDGGATTVKPMFITVKVDVMLSIY